MPWNFLTKFEKDFLAECLSWIAMGRQDDFITGETPDCNGYNWCGRE